MNKIYKVIWSKAKHCYVVVSELAKSHTKGCGKRSLRRTAVSLGIVATLLGGFSGSAWADGSGTIEFTDKTYDTEPTNTTTITYTITGAGSVSVSQSDMAITITGTDNDTIYTPGGGITISAGNEISAKVDGSSISVGTNGLQANATGSILSDNTGLVNGGQVYTAIQATQTNSNITGGSISGVTVDATSLKINGTSLETAGLTGTHTIDSGSTGYVTGGTVFTAVTGGTLALSGATLNAAGNATVGGTLSVTGAATVGSLTIGTTAVDTAGLAGDHTIDSGSTGYVSGSTVYDYLNGATLALGANSTNIAIGKGNSIPTSQIPGDTPTDRYNTVIGYNNKIADFAGDSEEASNSASLNVFGANNKILGSSNSIVIGNNIHSNYGSSGDDYANSLFKDNNDILLGNNVYISQKVNYGIGIGENVQLISNNAIAIGSYENENSATTASGDSAIAIGSRARASAHDTGGESVALGAGAYAYGDYTTAIGASANAGSETTGPAPYATAVGRYSQALMNYAIAIGGGDQSGFKSLAATASEKYSIAMGYRATASKQNAIAIGSGTNSSDGNQAGATASGDSAIAIGDLAEAATGYTIAMGSNAIAETATGTIAIGFNAHAYGNNTATAIGRGATGWQGTAVGENANAYGAGTTALGESANAGAENAMALGAYANASAQYATAIGRSVEATVDYATVVGTFAKATALNAIAIGGGEFEVDSTDPENPIITYKGAAASAQNAIAIGYQAKATISDSVALGSDAVTTRGAYATTTYNAYLNEDGSKTPDTASTETKNAWRSTHSAVAVGNDATVTRQITGVAAGSADTDAVNVAQLKSATPVIDSLHNYYDGRTTAVNVTDAVDAVDKALGKIATGNYITAYVAATTTTEATGTFADNLTALDIAIGKVTANGNYIKASSTKNVAENLSLLDAQAKTNADNIGTLQTKTQNITATAGTTIMEGVLNVVPAGGTTGIAISGTDKTITGLSNITWNASAIASGRAATEDQLQLATSSLSTTLTDTGLQFGANLNTATNNDTVVTNKLGSQVKVLGGGAQSGHTYSAANVTTEITQEAGNSTIIIKLDHNPTFGNISGASLAVSGMLSSASLKVNNIDVTTPLTTPGAVASGNPGFVIGGTVYSEVRPTADGNYVKTANTTAANLTVLDTQVKTNADNITALQSSTTAAVGTLTEDGNYIKKSSTNNIVQNLSALDTQVKTNTDDIATLKNSISVQEDASGTKTTTIEGNLVIKEEDGTTKDVTAALSTDGEVAKKGDAGSEGFLKGETVYDYLNKGDNGKEVKLATESQQISIGKGSEASGAESIAIGNEVGTQKNQATGTQSIAIGFGNQVTGDHSGAIGDPNTLTGTDSYVIGNNNTIGGNNTFVLGNNVTANVDNAVVLGNNSTAEANAVSVGSVGGERQIKHVAPGTDANDAATFGQLSALAQAADNSIGRLDSKVNKVGAGAAALAALHPIDTDDKFTMGLGYGNYRDAHSAAIGLFYRPTEKVMISVGGTLGNGENMINAGISFALDKGKGFGTSKAMMARKIAAQEEKITQQDAKILSLEEENAKLAARLAAIEEKLAK